MAGHKGSKYYDVFLDYRIWLNKGEKGVLGDGKIHLLELIDEHGSLRAAAEKMGISYRKAWGNIKEAEEELGIALVDRQRGGQHGGASTLTEDGKSLVEAFKQLRKDFDESINKVTQKFFNKLNKEDAKENNA